MNRFSFSLARVLDLRSQIEDLERGRLANLASRHQHLVAQAADDAQRSLAIRSQALAGTRVVSLDLQRSWAYADWLERSRVETLTQASRVARDIELQRKVVADARRARRLLEILRQKKFAAHARLSLREEDAIAADLHLAKLSRERAGEPGTDRPIHLH